MEGNTEVVDIAEDKARALIQAEERHKPACCRQGYSPYQRAGMQERNQKMRLGGGPKSNSDYYHRFVPPNK